MELIKIEGVVSSAGCPSIQIVTTDGGVSEILSSAIANVLTAISSEKTNPDRSRSFFMILILSFHVIPGVQVECVEIPGTRALNKWAQDAAVDKFMHTGL